MENRFEKINREVERDLHEFFCDSCNLTKIEEKMKMKIDSKVEKKLS